MRAAHRHATILSSQTIRLISSLFSLSGQSTSIQVSTLSLRRRPLLLWSLFKPADLVSLSYGKGRGGLQGLVSTSTVRAILGCPLMLSSALILREGSLSPGGSCLPGPFPPMTEPVLWGAFLCDSYFLLPRPSVPAGVLASLGQGPVALTGRARCPSKTCNKGWVSNHCWNVLGSWVCPSSSPFA